MMKNEVMNLSGDNPVLCADGKMAMLIQYPANDDNCGVQVHGEEDIRWIDCSTLTASNGGAIRQDGSPKLPNSLSDMVQKMLALDWVSRGGC